MLFHERERQFTKINSITSHKMQAFRKSYNILQKIEDIKKNEEMQLENTQAKTRKLKRNGQKSKISYADDF